LLAGAKFRVAEARGENLGGGCHAPDASGEPG
jgi:hypothetical protein